MYIHNLVCIGIPTTGTQLLMTCSIGWASRESVNSGLDYWNGLLDWTTGLTFDLNIMGFCRITISYMIIGASRSYFIVLAVLVYLATVPSSKFFRVATLI